ncbi:MAG: 2-oxoglutarate dehydrogenase complex dihydrolipoyllysine-residue succinyltransferase, partial [Gammaproteobacteria bacterium]
MTIEIRVPQLPESVADATLVAWHKKPGDAVSRDENLADLETDKVVLEVPAPTHGVMDEIRVQSGTTVTSGQVLAVIREKLTADSSQPTARREEKSEAARDNDKLSPSVRRLVEENRLDPTQIPASGRDGRITKSDVVDYLDKQRDAPTSAAAPAAARATQAPATAREAPPKAPSPAPATAKPPAPRVGRTEQRVAMTRLRQRIAQRMVEAQSTQALLTSFNEVDLTEVQALRARYKDRFEKQHGVKLGFMSFFVKACIEALKRFPVVNASVDGTDMVYHEYYDIGVAVSTDRGLMVPVVRDADVKSFAEIEKEIGAYAQKARDGTIALEDLIGGTFTITNGGVFGSLMSTPIVNAPQSAILGMHKIQERPMVVNGAIAIRPMMYVA